MRKNVWIASLIAVILSISAALAWLPHGTTAVGVAPSTTCPYGSVYDDGCATATGIYFADGSQGTTPYIPTGQMTAASWGALARQSGQHWQSDHPQSYNLAGVDYGVGPAVPVHDLTDIAGWNSLSGNVTLGAAGTFAVGPAATGCVYMPNKITSSGTYPTFTGTLSSGVLTVTSGTSPSVGNVIAGSGVNSGTVVVSGSGTTFQTNQTQTRSTSTNFTATDYPQITNWPISPTNHPPAFFCPIFANTTAVTIAGQNFGPFTDASQGHPVGTHGCVIIAVAAVSQAVGTGPIVTFKDNAIINGAGCAQTINTNGYNLVNIATAYTGTLVVTDNYVDGKDNDPDCCLLTSTPPNDGGFVEGSIRGNIDIERNYEINVNGSYINFLTGSEARFPCSPAGQTPNFPLTTPGYTLTHQGNFITAGNKLGGSSHYETISFASSAVLCSNSNLYNTLLFPNSVAAETDAPFSGLLTDVGAVEWTFNTGNTVVTNLIGLSDSTSGRTFPHFYDYYNWSTKGTTPNTLEITAYGSKCSSLPWACSDPAWGQFISGGTNNTHSSQPMLQGNSGTGPLTGSNWAAGCNQSDGGTLCSAVSIYMLPGLVTGVLNSLADNRVASAALSEMSHGNKSTGSGTVTGAVTLSSSANTIQVSACPTNTGGTTVGTIVVDGATQIGVEQSCSGSTLTLFASNIDSGFSVGAGDTLSYTGFSYGKMIATNNYFDGIGTGQGTMASAAIPHYNKLSLTTGACLFTASLSGNVEMRQPIDFTPTSVTGATYDSVHGVVTLTLAANPWGSAPLANIPGSYVIVTGVVASDGNPSLRFNTPPGPPADPLTVLAVRNNGTEVDLLNSAGGVAVTYTSGGTISLPSPDLPNRFISGPPGNSGASGGGC